MDIKQSDIEAAAPTEKEDAEMFGVTNIIKRSKLSPEKVEVLQGLLEETPELVKMLAQSMRSNERREQSIIASLTPLLEYANAHKNEFISGDSIIKDMETQVGASSHFIEVAASIHSSFTKLQAEHVQALEKIKSMESVPAKERKSLETREDRRSSMQAVDANKLAVAEIFSRFKGYNLEASSERLAELNAQVRQPKYE